jgi:hypothetical protein
VHLLETFIRNLIEDARYRKPQVGKKFTILGCVVSQKSADLIYVAAEAWNHADETSVS